MTEMPYSPAQAFNEPVPTVTRFRLVKFSDIQLDKSPPYLVRGLIPREGMIVVWGPPKCGKSFWAFDLGLHVALGWAYRGRAVKSGPVVYVACEGERGLRARAAAFRLQKLAESSDDLPFHLVATQLDLVADCPTLIADIKAQLAGDRPVLVVIDTLNRSMRGSENSDEDMGEYVKSLDAIRAAFSSAVLVVHHCGTNDKRPRGHTSLTGAADAQIAVARQGDGLITAKVEYMKDGIEGEVVASRLEPVDLGGDDDGQPISSCIVAAADGEAGKVPISKPRLTGQTKTALDLLHKALAEAGEIPPASHHIPGSVRVVRVDLWQRYCETGGLSAGEDESASRKAFKRARDRLRELNLICIWDVWVWPVGP